MGNEGRIKSEPETLKIKIIFVKCWSMNLKRTARKSFQIRIIFCVFLGICSAYEIIQLKGYTNWAIGTMVGTLCNAILKNQKNVYALSTMVKVSVHQQLLQKYKAQIHAVSFKRYLIY